MAPYKIIEHTADMGIVIWADTLAEVFSEAAQALFKLLVQINTPHPTTTSEFRTLEGEDLEDLLVNWLRELLFLFNGEGKIVSSTTIITMEPKKIKAKIDWFLFAPDTDECLVEIKAVTYHKIRVERVSSGFEAQVIFDI